MDNTEMGAKKRSKYGEDDKVWQGFQTIVFVKSSAFWKIDLVLKEENKLQS